MDPRDKAKLKEMIRQEIAGLHTRIAELETVTQPVEPDAAIGRLSRMDTIVNQEVNEVALRAAKTRRLKLTRALEAIDSPEYGYCAACGERIPLPRLLALPESDLCVHCAA
ncbi:MAG: TraR/DksA family transcriptional regulator [Desulfovibrionaceae bacterium]